MNSKDEEFGEERLGEYVRSILNLSADEIIKRTISEIKAFVGETPQMDDMTMVILKRLHD